MLFGYRFETSYLATIMSNNPLDPVKDNSVKENQQHGLQGPEVQNDSEILSNELTDSELDKVSGGRIMNQGGGPEARIFPHVEQDN